MGRWAIAWVIGWLVASLAMWFRLVPIGFPMGLALIVVLWRPLLDSVRGVAHRPGRIAVAILITAIVTFFATVVMQSFVTPALASLADVGDLTSANTSEWMQRLRQNPWWYPVLVFAGPLGEELAYRFGIFRLVGRLNVILAHLVTAGLFGLQHVVAAWLSGHPEQLLLIPGYAVTSLIWTIAYRRTGNLMVSFGAHALTNGIPLALILLSR